MNESNTGSVRFEQKFLVTWLITGAVIGLIGGIAVIAQGHIKGSGILGAIVASVVGFPMWLVSQAGLGILFNAAFRHNWRFGEIKFPPWVWYIYPIVAILDIVFSFILAFLIGLVTGRFR